MDLPTLLTDVEKDLIDIMLKHNVIDEISIRNFQIKQRYLQLLSLKDGSGKNQYSKNEIRHIIAEEYSISDRTVQRIIYYK